MKVSTVRLNNQLELDLSSYKLSKAGRVIHLEKMPMELLLLLAEKRGQLVTREEIIERLWGRNIFVDTRQGINTAIRKIRLATNDDPEKPRVLETVVGKGYRLIVADHEPPTAGDSDSIPTPTIGVRSRFAGMLFAVGAVICIAIVGLWWRRTPSQVLGAQSEWSQLTNSPDSAACPALSPDGGMLAFVRGGCSSTGQIYVETLPGGKPVQLTHNRQVKGALAFSPDGSRVSYSVIPAWDTWVVPVLGGEPELMLANASGLQWLDSKHVLFSELERGVHMGIVTATVNRAGERGVYLPAREVGMAHASRLSPDGKSLLVVEMDAQDWTPCRLVPFDGSSSGKLVGPPGAACLDAGWSPDGKWMFLDVDTGRGFHIWRQGSANGKPEQITNGPTEQLGIAVPRDGRSLLTSVSVSSSTIWVHDQSGARKVPFAGSAGFPIPQVSSRAIFHENKLYFLGKEGPEDSWDLWAMDLRSQRAARVLSGMGIESFDISRDGKQIAFAAIGSARPTTHSGTLPDNATFLWVADIDKVSTPHLLDSAAARRPLFGSNDDLIFEADEGSSTYAYVRNLRSGGLRKITTNPIVRLETVSPDGRWVVAEVPIVGEDVTRGVAGIDLQDGTARRICHGLCVARWTLDGKSLFLSLPSGEKDSESWLGAKTFVIPLHAGQSFRDLPPAGVRSDAEALRMAGTTVINEFVRPGTDASVYAFDRREVHANIYRIPLQN